MFPGGLFAPRCTVLFNFFLRIDPQPHGGGPAAARRSTWRNPAPSLQRANRQHGPQPPRGPAARQDARTWEPVVDGARAKRRPQAVNDQQQHDGAACPEGLASSLHNNKARRWAGQEDGPRRPPGSAAESPAISARRLGRRDPRRDAPQVGRGDRRQRGRQAHKGRGVRAQTPRRSSCHKPTPSWNADKPLPLACPTGRQLGSQGAGVMPDATRRRQTGCGQTV